MKRLVEETDCLHGYFRDCTFKTDVGLDCPGGTSREVALPDGLTVRSYFRANMFDGDEGGLHTATVKRLLDDMVDVVGFIFEDLEEPT